MWRLEFILIPLIAVLSMKLSWEMGSKSGAAHARIEMLTQRYVADLQIAEAQRMMKK